MPVDHSQVAQDWRQRGYSCDVFTDPPGREWNDFVHMTNELVTVIAGKLMLTIGGEEILVDPGDEVFIPKNTLHSVKNVSPSTTHWLYGYENEERFTKYYWAGRWEQRDLDQRLNRFDLR